MWCALAYFGHSTGGDLFLLHLKARLVSPGDLVFFIHSCALILLIAGLESGKNTRLCVPGIMIYLYGRKYFDVFF